MKIIKTIIAVAVITIIGFFIWKWLVVIDKPKEITPPINQFTEKIESEIDSLKQMPANIFCKKFYNDIQYLIIDYHQKKFLGKSVSDNNQWQEILSKNLYFAYAPKFIEQTMYIFSHSEWKNDDLQFIRSEVDSLNSSPFLDSTGPVANSFNSISAILAKYDEIICFIYTCNSFSYSVYELNNSFPDLSDKIQKSRACLAENSENQYVNNCTRLNLGLQEIPKKLFGKHVIYLQRKINRHGGRYAEFNYQSEYSNIIYTPLKNQIDDLDNKTYGIGNNAFDSGYNSLYNLLSSCNRNATDYFFRIIEKKNKVKNFISSCNGFSYSNYELNSSFPDLRDKIQKSRVYLTNNLDNQYLNIVLNNNAQIKDGLKDIPKKLFDKHVSFLQRKINNNGGRYTEFKNKDEYSSIIYTPLRNQVEALNNIYGLSRSVFNNGYNYIDNLLRKFNDDANYYYSQSKRWQKKFKKGKR